MRYDKNMWNWDRHSQNTDGTPSLFLVNQMEADVEEVEEEEEEEKEDET